MFRVLVLGELTRHLKSYRLLLAVVAGPLCMVVAATIHQIDLREQVSAYSRLARSAESDANLDWVLLPRPYPTLGFVSADGADRTEATVLRPHLAAPVIPGVSERSWVFVAQPLDWAAVVVLLYSLMAVALTYDAVAGEKAQGTLRVLTARPIGRMSLILSKIAGSFLVVALSFVLGAVASLAVVAVDGGGSLSAETAPNLVLAVVLVLVFLLFNVLLGVAASVSVARPAAALQRALGAWTVLALVVPAGVTVAGSMLHPLESEAELQRNFGLVSMEFRERLSVSSEALAGIVNREDLSPAQKRARIASLEADMMADQEAALAEQERALAEVRRDYLRQSAAQRTWTEKFSALSPFSLLRRSLDRLSFAGWSGEREFLRQVDRFEPTFTEFVIDQRRQRRDEAGEGVAMALIQDAEGEEYRLRGITGLSYAALPIRPGEGPRFAWRRPSPGELVNQTVGDVLWMVLFVAGATGWVARRFASYDCR